MSRIAYVLGIIQPQVKVLVALALAIILDLRNEYWAQGQVVPWAEWARVGMVLGYAGYVQVASVLYPEPSCCCNCNIQDDA
jgi:hypothetical protein